MDELFRYVILRPVEPAADDRRHHGTLRGRLLAARDGTDAAGAAAAMRAVAVDRVAVSGRPAPRTIFDDPAALDASYLNLTATMVHDVNRWESFNLNPRENGGHQIDALIAWDDGTNNAAMLAVNYGFSGAVTTDVPALREALAADAAH